MSNDDDLLLDNLTRDARRHQLEALYNILQRNAKVRYLQHHLHDYNMPNIDAATFRRAVPLSTYEDYSDHINRLANDPLHHDMSLLSMDPLDCFFYSSGTTSMKPKLIPSYHSSLSKAAWDLADQIITANRRRLFPPRTFANKTMVFFYADNATVTKGGFKVTSASSYLFQRSIPDWSRFPTFITSPKEVFVGSDTVEHQMYCHLLCGLRNSDFIDMISAPYALGLINVFNLLRSKWKQLCDDLENGELQSLEISDVAMRNSVNEVLGGPQLDLSKRFRSICEEGNWGGIVKRLWPNVRYVRCVTTGSMKPYYPQLKYYAGDQVALLGGDFYTSECCVGINSDITQPPETTRYVMLPTAAYFEFLPYHDPNDDEINAVICEETVDFSGVEVGKMYEIVATTFGGFYRYRLGDIVRVVGFYNSAPEVEYVMRAPKALSDIITERDLMSAMESFQLVLRSELAAEIKESASFLDLNFSPKRLKVFVEVKQEGMFIQEKLQETILVLRRACSVLEDNLGGLYKANRDKGDTGPLLVSIIKPGSFETLSKVAIENGTPACQYKPPKIIRNQAIVCILERSALVTVFPDSMDE